MGKLISAGLIVLLAWTNCVYAASPKASQIITDTTNFDGNLSSADATVQDALETLDEIAGGAGSGDVTGVGDCTSGACLDGTSDGGTWIKFYDAQGAGQLITGDLSAARVWTMPDNTGTVLTSASTLNGENLGDDTVDDDSIDFSDITLNDFTFDVGSVDKTEFGYLDGVTSAIQTQLNGKESATSNDFDPDRLAGDTSDDNLIDDAIIASTIARDSELHDAVTLGTDANTILGLSTQQLTLDTQTANYIWAGPTTGAAADPTFRALVDADIPAAIARDSELPTASSLSVDDLITLSGVAEGAVNLGTFTGSTIDDNLTIKAAFQDLESAVEGLGGGHDAVTLAADADAILSLSTQEIGLDTQDANTVFAGPVSGGAADPDFRSLVAADIPDISATYATATHASQHAVGGGDTVFPADPGADRYLMWDDDPGALAWAEGSGGGTYTAGGTLLQLDGTEFSVDEGILTDGRYCVYSAGIGLVCNSTGTGSGAAYDDIGDPDGNGSINMGSYTGTYYSATDGWAGMYISSTDTDLTSDTYLLSLYSADSADANFKPFRVVEDTAGSPTTVFSIVGGGVTTIAGGLTVSAGVVDAGGASSLEIPNGTGPTVDAAGEIAVDTSSDQLIYYGTAKRVVPTFHEKGFVLESPTADDDDVPFWHPHDNITITDVYCETQGGTSCEVTISDGTNALETITCDADGQADDGSIVNGTFTANERMEFDIGTVSGAVDWVSVSITYTIDAD